MSPYLTKEKYRRSAARINVLRMINAAIEAQFSTQWEAAEAIGCTQSTISNWHSLKGGSLALIAVAMEVLGLEVQASKRRVDVRRTSRVKEGSHSQGVAVGQSAP
jgi:predicted XRE-type DNA-binding protein